MLFRPNPRFVEEMVKDPDYRAGMRDVAETVAENVRSVAPYKSGAYRDSLEVVDDGENLGVKTTDFAGHIIEWGGARHPAFAPLRRGARAAGLRLDEEPK